VDRVIAVSMPLRAKTILTSKRTLLNILAMGVFSVLLNFPRWIESIRWEYPIEGRFWNFYEPRSLVLIKEYRTIYQLYGWSFFMYVIPFALMMILNIKIWWEVGSIYRNKINVLYILYFNIILIWDLVSIR